MSETLGRREQKKINNRKAILDAGLEVFSSIGYERATINDIVNASGLSVGTFYNHCGDKDTIFSELLSVFLQEVRSTLSLARTQADSLESLVMGAFLSYSELIARYPKMQELIVKNTSVFKQMLLEDAELVGIIDDLQKDMKIAVDAGIAPDFPISMTASAMISASIDVFSDSHSEFSTQERAEFLGNLFLGGIERLSKM